MRASSKILHYSTKKYFKSNEHLEQNEFILRKSVCSNGRLTSVTALAAIRPNLDNFDQKHLKPRLIAEVDGEQGLCHQTPELSVNVWLSKILLSGTRPGLRPERSVRDS